MRPCRSRTSGTFLDPRATKGTPQATGGRGTKTSRSLPGRRRAVTPQNAHGGDHSECIPPLARTGAPYDRLPRGGAQAVLRPQGCKAPTGTAPGEKETWPSRRRSRTPPPAARRVVFNEGMDRDQGGPYDPHAQRTSSTADPRRRSKRPRTEQAHIPTILTPVEHERQAALHAGPRPAADGPSSSSAGSLPGSATDPLPGGPHATDTRPREPAADPRPAQRVGGQPPPPPPPRE